MEEANDGLHAKYALEQTNLPARQREGSKHLLCARHFTYTGFTLLGNTVR